MKVSTSGHLAVADYFKPYNTVQESNDDEDLSSGGALVLPGLKDAFGRLQHLAVDAGKDSSIMWSTELAERPASSGKLEFSWTKE